MIYMKIVRIFLITQDDKGIIDKYVFFKKRHYLIRKFYSGTEIFYLQLFKMSN